MTDRTFVCGEALFRAEWEESVARARASRIQRERLALREAIARALETWRREHPGMRA